MKLRLVTAGAGAAWESALVQACQAGRSPRRWCTAATTWVTSSRWPPRGGGGGGGRRRTRWLDRDALARLAAAGLAVVGVASAGDEASENRLRQLGLLRVASNADPPEALVDRARAALVAEPALDDELALDQVPARSDGDERRVLAAVWGPKGAPGRTTVAVNLAFEAAAAGGEVLLVDADTYGGAVAHANMQEHHRKGRLGSPRRQ